MEISELTSKNERDAEFNFDKAWEVLHDEVSWKLPTDKEAVLTTEFGITEKEQLSYIYVNDVKELASKLKKIPAKILASCFNINI